MSRVLSRLGWVPTVLAAGGVVAAIEVGLRTTTLPRLADRCGAPLAPATVRPAADGAVPPRLSPREAARLRAVAWALRHSPFGSTCLRRALAAGVVLRRRGPHLVVGVAKCDGVVTAHAWLEIDGHNLDPEGSSSFVPLAIDPGALTR